MGELSCCTLKMLFGNGVGNEVEGAEREVEASLIQIGKRMLV